MINIDKKMQKYGYKKVEEDCYDVIYEKIEDQGFTHVVTIVRKSSGKHILQSYDKKVISLNGHFMNECCGIEIPVLFLMWLKAKKMSRKYHWKKVD